MVLDPALGAALVHRGHQSSGGRGHGGSGLDLGDLLGGPDPVIQGRELLVLDPDVSFLGRRGG